MIPSQSARIEKIARKTILQANSDPFLLRDLVERLQVFSDEKLGHGEDALVVRGRNGESPIAVLKSMENSPQFASRRTPEETSDGASNLEANTASLIDKKIRSLAPNGEPLLLPVSTRIEIADRIYAEHGLPSSRDRIASPHRNKRPNSETAGPPSTAEFGGYSEALAEKRETIAQDSD